MYVREKRCISQSNAPEKDVPEKDVPVLYSAPHMPSKTALIRSAILIYDPYGP